MMSDMIELLAFRQRFNACLAEVGIAPAPKMRLEADLTLHIEPWLAVEPSVPGVTILSPEAIAQLTLIIKALGLSAPGFEPAERLLAATMAELGRCRCH